MENFYAKIVQEFIRDNNASILVCGAGTTDTKVFGRLPYINVTMCGMDLRPGIQGKFKMLHENAEALSFGDNAFDYTIMHASIHHVRLPHKVLTELYRVSKKGFLAIESRDSVLIRITQKIGLTEEFEVKGNFPGSGVNGTDIPNYIYRWTEREVEKTIKCFDPCNKQKYYYRYGTVYPDGVGISLRKKYMINIFQPIHRCLSFIFPKQQNHFSFFVGKCTEAGGLHPWLALDSESKSVIVNREYIKNTYLNR